MGENLAFGARRIPLEVVASLSKIARMQPSNLLPCLDVLLESSATILSGFRRKRSLPTAAFSKQWKIVEGHLSKAEAAMAKGDPGLFDVIVRGRIYKEPDKTVEELLLSALVAYGKSPHAAYARLLQELRCVAEFARNSVKAAPARRPVLRIGGEGWTEQCAFAAIVYETILRAGGQLRASRNDGGSLHRFLAELKPFSGIAPPAGFRALERVTQLVDSNPTRSPT